ncbi:histidine kinase [Nocardia sp. NPDC005998]|uniref:sensor histidine kinase n=1 Tax=Nocardia sp. NPDC005998 TaxID=3156894 RepID=UPI0033B9A447
MNTDVAAPLGGWQQAWRLLAAAALGLALWLNAAVLLPPGHASEPDSWFVTGDPLVGLGCLLALLWRRRFPLAVALLVVFASSVSILATGAAWLALCSVSTRRRPMEIGAVVLVYVIAAQFSYGLYPIASTPTTRALQLALPILSAGVAVAVGMAIGTRRLEERFLRDRAESAEREQAARAAQARAEERTRIAREMHDVLAHRISLVAMQAGVLDHRSDLPAEDSRVLIRGIADGSRQALEELRDVLGVLRADPNSAETPQPAFDRIPELVAETRTSGLDVTLSTSVSEIPSDAVGRTCYRIVQEGLTNVAKHAPGATVHIRLSGTAGDQLHVSVRNSAATSTIAVPAPTSGFGLLGLTERIGLAGGKLMHHPTTDHGYLLTAQLPWPNPNGHRRI